MLLVPEQVHYGSLMRGRENNLETCHFQCHSWEKWGDGGMLGRGGRMELQRDEGMKAREGKKVKKREMLERKM